jgi:deoxyribonuclease-4
MDRSLRLGADFVILHPGHGGRDEPAQAGLDRVAAGLIEALSGWNEEKPRLLLETTSGQKGELGKTFEELADIIQAVEAALEGRRLGVCLDTAHIFAAGYDLKSAAGQDAVLAAFDRVLGADRLQMIHFNDSKIPLAGRRDRHAPPGRGEIGARAMARLVRHKRLEGLAGIMESPRVSLADDVEVMKRVKGWRRRKKA